MQYGAGANEPVPAVDPLLSDAGLVTAARGGDMRAFERLYRAHSGKVMGLCLRMTRRRDVAEDCVQQTFLGPAELEVKTVSGNIIARGLRGGKSGSVRATSISGDLLLDDLGPEVDLNTVSGDMAVHLDRLDRGRIKTTNGDLDLTTRLGDAARLDAEAINGDLSFTLRGSINAEFDIETFNGDIDNCFGPEPSRGREYGPGNELRFTQGKGDARVRIKTLNGAVTVCKR